MPQAMQKASVLVMSSGFMTMRRMVEGDQFQAKEIDVRGLHVPTLNPLDEATILAEVRRLGRLVVVAENHSVIGGLGEAVAGLLMRSGVATTFRQIGLRMPFSTRVRCRHCMIATASPRRR